MGQIPEECKIDFIVTDENDKNSIVRYLCLSSEMPIEQLNRRTLWFRSFSEISRSF